MTDLKLAALRQALDESSNDDSVIIQERAEQIYLWLVRDDSPEMTLEQAMAEMRNAPLVPIDDKKLQCRFPISADIAAAINGDEAARERLSARGILVFSATMSIAEPEPEGPAEPQSKESLQEDIEACGKIAEMFGRQGKCGKRDVFLRKKRELEARLGNQESPAPAAEAPLDSPKVFDQSVDSGSIRGRCSFPPATEEMTSEEQAAAKKMWEDSKPAAEQPFNPIGKEVWVKASDGKTYSHKIQGGYIAPDGDNCYMTARGFSIWGKDEGLEWAWSQDGFRSAAEPAKREPQIGDTIIWDSHEHIIFTLYSGSRNFYAVRTKSHAETFLFDLATEGTEGGWNYKD